MPKLSSECPPYAISLGVTKSALLLNDQVHFKYFTDSSFPSNTDILLAYRILLQFLANDKEVRSSILPLKDDKLFWTQVCQFFAKAPYSNIGKILN